MKELKPLRIKFDGGAVDLTRYGWTIYEAQPDTWGGGLALAVSGLCDDSSTLVRVGNPTADQMKAALRALRGLNAQDKRKLQRRSDALANLCGACLKSAGHWSVANELKLVNQVRTRKK